MMQRTLAVGLLVMLMAGTVTAKAQPSLPGPLVEADWLLAHQGRVTVLDARTDLFTFELEPDERAPSGARVSTGLCDEDLLADDDDDGPRIRGHIPGAVLVDRRDLDRGVSGPHGETRWLMADAERFQAVMRAAGVSNDRPVVVTGNGLSDGDVAEAARLVWALRHYGHSRVALLDGGVAAWLEAGYGLDSEASGPSAPGDFTARSGSLAADAGAVESALAENGALLVDTRAESFFRGVFGRDYVNGRGHIPGAVNWPYSALTEGHHAVRTETPARLRDVEGLARMAAEAGVDTEGAAILYCNSGNQASLTWFVLHELLGMESVRLYDGSLHDWTLDPKRELARP